MPFTLTAPPGLSDLPDAALNAEEIAQGQHAVKILENTKFGVVRPEFFYMGRFSDGQTVARPTSAVDNLPYLASEVIYVWEIVLSADPRDGITSGPGTILYFDYDVEQRTDGDPGLVHCKTVYHVQGGQTTETRDGELSVWAVGIRGLDQLDLAAIPAWANISDTAFDLDSAWTTQRITLLNGSAKRAVVQAEFFDLGEFGNGQTVPRPTSDVDGFLYPYADLVFLTSWRWTPAFATGLSSGPSGATLARLEKSVVGGTGVVDTTVTYRFGAGSDTVTQDGRVRVFAFGFRAGITATGTVSFIDQNANVFLPGKPPLDDDTLVMVRNSKFAALRPEFFVTNQAHGTTVPLPTSPIDGYAYARAELIYLYARSDTAAPGSIGSLLTLHGFVRQDTGAVTLKTLYFRQGGAVTNTNNGTFRVVTVALRSKDIEVDGDPTDPGGGEPGLEPTLDGLGDGLRYHFREEVFVEYFEQDVHTAWNLRAGGATVTYPSDGQAGGRVLQAAGNQEKRAYPDNIPFDPSKLYRIRCRVRQTVNSSDPAKDLFTVGVEGVAADGTTLVNRTGANSSGNQHYICVYQADGGGWGLNTWVEYTGYFKGWAGTGSNESPDPANPGKLHTNVRYFRPVFIINYNGGDGTQQLDYIAVDVLPDDYGSNFELMPSLAVGDWTNPENAFDGDEDTYAQSFAGLFELLGYAPIITIPYDVKVKMISSSPNVPSGATVYGEYSKNSGSSWVQIYARTSSFGKAIDEVTIATPPTKTSKIKQRQRLEGGSTANSTQNGGTFANESYGPGTQNWASPSNAQTSNNAHASVALLAEAYSNYLKITNFPFAVTGVVQGIRVRVERKASATGWITDSEVRLVKGGVISGQNKASGASWPTTDAYVSYGDSTDLWYQGWLIGDINANDFGIAIAVLNNDVSATRTASIDHIEITVWYSGNMPTGRLHEATVVLSLK